MAQTLYANNVASVLGAAIGPSDTAILLQAGAGVNWPVISGGNWLYATLVHQATGVIEIVKVTAKSGDTLTCVRGQDFTSAKSFTTGSLIEMRCNAQILRELDYRTVAGQANGVATLDATTHLTASQLPTNVPVKDGGGKILVADLPNEVLLETEATATYLKLIGGTLTGTLVINKGAAAAGATNEQGWTNGNFSIVARACSTAGSNNPIIQANDSFLGVQSTAVNGACALVIGPWVNTNQGIRISPSGVALHGTNVTANGNAIWHAANFDPTDYALKNNTALTGSLTSTGGATWAGDLKTYRSATPTTGVLFLNQAGTRYLFFDGTDYLFNLANVKAPNFIATSDIREKENIRIHDVDPYLADNLQMYDFDWKETGMPGCGPMAQDVRDVAIQHVHGTDRLGIDKGGLAIEAVVGLAARVRALESLLNAERIPCTPVN